MAASAPRSRWTTRPGSTTRTSSTSKRIRLADIDGSGTTDIIYLHRDGVRLYFNQSGNSWSAAADRCTSSRASTTWSPSVPADLLGNGTACLVWSSPLPGDARRPMRYVDLMGGQKAAPADQDRSTTWAPKPRVQYAPSTKFYLQDKHAGKPWITKLPFPVHVVEKVTVTDKWRKTSFSSTYSYHHGYFDGIEREFRGFGRVEQVDVESYGEFAARQCRQPLHHRRQDALPAAGQDRHLVSHRRFSRPRAHPLALRARILPPLAGRTASRPVNMLGDFQENVLPQPDLDAENLSAEEWREALRACKGMMLRQEVYELDVDALERPEDPEQLPVKLFSTAYHNCHIRRLQPKAWQSPRGLPGRRKRGHHLPLRTGSPGSAVTPAQPRPAHRPHAESAIRRVRQCPAIGGRRLSAPRQV